MGQSGGGPSPIAVIVATTTTGAAPFAVHVNGLNSIVGVGDESTARYEWDFGDPAGAHNALVGWNAAHIYNVAGSYTITLTLTNQSGQQNVKTIPVTVGAANRTSIYVSPSGSDSNSGLSPSSAIKTFAKAATMLGNNKAILFQRGAAFDVSGAMTISQQNVLVGAYGAGAIPILNWTPDVSYAKIIDMGSSAKDVVIENLKFTSPFAPNNLIVRGIHPHGNNVTVRNCSFGNVSYAMNTDGEGVNALLTQDNFAGVIGAYYIWAKGNDHTHLGNTVQGSVDEHNIRFGNAYRVLISDNDLTNTAKSTIWCMLGNHCYVRNNKLREGRFIAGPNFATSSPGERFPWVVFENNEMFNAGVVLYSGAEEITFRNNVIHYNGGEVFSIWGYLAQWDRTCTNISMYNNTATNTSTQYGKFAKVGAGAVHVVVADNLYCSPGLYPPGGSGNIVSDDNTLNTHSFHDNLWSTPSSGVYPHKLSTGGQTVSQWAAYFETTNEMYRAFQGSDLNGSFVPQFNAAVGTSIPGVFTDYYNNLRPASGPWTVGAVELNPGGDPSGPDINGDGLVNSADLLIVLSQWGQCGSCIADVDNDGVVNSADIVLLMAAWD